MKCSSFYVIDACDGKAYGYGDLYILNPIANGDCNYQNWLYCDTLNQTTFGFGPQKYNGDYDCSFCDDADKDGHYTPLSSFTPNDDCNDYDPKIYPGAPEVCESGSIQVDNDCDGTAGWCVGNVIVDCPKGDPTVYPGADEVCDGKDNDCDGKVDEHRWEEAQGTPDLDLDKDGYFQRGCKKDCDDGDPAVHPGAEEICDYRLDNGYWIDNDCDGVANEGLSTDSDMDGYYTPGSCWLTLGELEPDCNDSDPTIHPWATEVCDGKNNNCNDKTDECCVDADADGHYDANFVYDWVLDPRTGRLSPTGTCYHNDDCNDNDATVYRGAPELCDGKDNDCFGRLIDDGIPPEPCYTGPEGTKDVGICMGGEKSCVNGAWTECIGEVRPLGWTDNGLLLQSASADSEPCDGDDNNCNGETDEGCSCKIFLSVYPDVVAPQRTDGNTEATVYLTPIQEIGKKCTVKLRVEPVPNSGGHDHHDATRPHGTLDRPEVTVNVGDTGSKTAKFKSKEVAGTERIIAEIVGGSQPIEPATIDVKLPMLGQMPEGLYWNLVGGVGVTSKHSDNHNAEASVIDAVAVIAKEYYNFTEEKLSINDMSLPWGGAFDLCNKWNPADTCPSYPDGGHSTHRRGTDVDVRSKDMTQDEKNDFRDIVCENHGFPMEHGASRHWHIFFQLYRDSDKKYCDKGGQWKK